MLRMHEHELDLYFPSIDVLATPISKVGNTALRSFLYAAEINIPASLTQKWV